MNIPNRISLFRLLLIPVFIISYFTFTGSMIWIPVAILLLSGISDIADGYIARKYQMITQLGKILDPLADKLTQISVIICLTIAHPQIIILLVIFFIKELLMLIGGIAIVRSGKKIDSAKWYGKVSTVVLFVTLFVILIGTGLSDSAVLVLSLFAAGVAIFSLVMYTMLYFKHIR